MKIYNYKISPSDAIILDKCISWINLTGKIIEENIGDYPYIDFSKNTDVQQYGD